MKVSDHGRARIIEREGLRRVVAEELLERAVDRVALVELPGLEPAPLREGEEALAAEGDPRHVHRLAHDDLPPPFAGASSTQASCT